MCVCVKWEEGATEHAPYILFKAHLERALGVEEQGGQYLSQMEALALVCFPTSWERTSGSWWRLAMGVGDLVQPRTVQ